MNILKSFSVYFFSAIIEKGIGFLILPILTGLLLPESIGKLSLLTSTYAFLAPFILINTSGAIYLEYHKKTYQSGNFPSYFSTAILINFISFLFFTVIIIFWLDWFVKQIDCPKEWILAIPLFCFFDAIKVTALSILQISKKPLYYSLVSLVYTILNFLFSLLFVYKFGMDYEGRLSGIFVSGLLISLFSFVLFYRMKLLEIRFSFAFLKDIFRYGFPLLPHAIGFLVLDLADRFFINHFAGKAELGIYSISYLISSMLYVLAGAFSNAWVPHLYDELKKDTPEAKLKIVKISYLYTIAIFVVAVSFVICLPFIYKIFINSNYYSGTRYAYLIISGYFFMSIYLIFAGIIFYEKKNYIFGYVALFNIFLNLGLNYILIKHYHAFGAALATCISMFMFMVAIAYYSNKIKALPWRLGLRELMGILPR